MATIKERFEDFLWEIKNLNKKAQKEKKAQQQELLDVFKGNEELSIRDEDGKSFLQTLVANQSFAKVFPKEVLEVILEANPAFIEDDAKSEDDSIPLAEALRLGLVEMVETMISCLQRHHLGLSQPKSLERAFEARPPLPVSLLIDLVRLSNRDMLQRKIKDRLIPLHLAVVYSRCCENPKKQPELVQLLLTMWEDGVRELVPAGTSFEWKTRQQTMMSWTSDETLSVYQWHHYTRRLIEEEEAKAAAAPAVPQGRFTNVPGLKPPDNTLRKDTDYDPRRKAPGGSAAKDSPAEPTKDGHPFAPPERKHSFPQHTRVQSPAFAPKSVKDGLDGKDGKDLKDGDSRRRDPKAGTVGISRPDNQSRPDKPLLDPEAAWRGREGAESETMSVTNESAYSAANRRALPSESVQPDNDAKAASNSIQDMLAESYLRRTVGTDADEGDARKFFEIEGGERRRYYFTLNMRQEGNNEPLPVKQEWIQRLEQSKLYHVLRHVSLSPVTVIPPAKTGEKVVSTGRKYTYSDELFFFQWLQQQMGVKKILRVTVDDSRRPHSDDDIEAVLGGRLRPGQSKASRLEPFGVEILDWQKLDLCPEVIRHAAPEVRELYLQWSGRNSVLRGWSEPEGLPLLKELTKVHLCFTQVDEGYKRTKDSIEAFRQRLTKARASVNLPEIEVDDSKGRYKSRVDRSDTGPDPNTASREDIHPWLKYAEDVVNSIPPLPSDPKLPPQLRQVTVALIDDGVSYLTSEMEKFHENFSLDGISFDESVEGPAPAPLFASLTGHGTFMARLILQVCPRARIIPYRLQMYPGKSGFVPHPQPLSAAKAIEAAINQGVDIISMSWTIRQPQDDPEPKGFSELRDVLKHIPPKSIPLLFCAAEDDGPYAHSGPVSGKVYPSDITSASTFRIGAATSEGQTWPRVSKQGRGLFVFPGVDIPGFVASRLDHAKDKLPAAQSDGKTGSSVATALAAGTAALLMHCVKLGAYYTERSNAPTSAGGGGGAASIGRDGGDNIPLQMVDDVRTYDTMSRILRNMSEENQTGAKTVLMHAFDKANAMLKDSVAVNGPLTDASVDYKRLAPIANLARNLIQI